MLTIFPLTELGVWKWSAFPADFVENWYQGEVARAKDSRSSTNSGAAAPVNAPSGPRSLSSRIAPLPSSAPPPPRAAVNAPRERRMSNSSVSGTAASTTTGITTGVQRLPKHLKDMLWEMFVDNLPRDVNVRSCRDFFDVCGKPLPFPASALDRMTNFCSLIVRWYCRSGYPTSRSFGFNLTLLARVFDQDRSCALDGQIAWFKVPRCFDEAMDGARRGKKSERNA